MAFAVQRTMANRAHADLSKSSTTTTDDQQQAAMVTPLSITTSHSSQLAIMIKRFLRRELGIVSARIKQAIN
jgi:hypothetical protein